MSDKHQPETLRMRPLTLEDLCNPDMIRWHVRCPSGIMDPSDLSTIIASLGTQLTEQIIHDSRSAADVRRDLDALATRIASLEAAETLGRRVQEVEERIKALEKPEPTPEADPGEAPQEEPNRTAPAAE